MPRNIPKKGIRVKYSKEEWDAAMADLRLGLPLDRVVANHPTVPRSTLGKHRHKSKFPKAGRRTVLSQEDEESLTEYLRLSASYGEGYTRDEVKDLVQQFVNEAGITARQWKDNRPGNDWFNQFLKRHPRLVPRKTEQMSYHRVAGCDPFIISEFFKDLKKLYDTEKITEQDGWRLYNCDESAFTHDPQKTVVYAGKGERRVSKNIAGTGKECTTVLACGSADGKKLPPMIVFSGSYVWSTWVSNNDYPGTAYTAQKKGWMEGTLFCHWFEQIFLQNVPSKEERKGNKLILFFDGAACHINSRMIKTAKQNDVILVKFPPNVTQYLQPLDLCVFRPIKAEWEKNLLQWNRDNSTKVLDKASFSSLLRLVWEDGFKGRNLISGFRATGLFPLDFNKFPEKAYNSEKLQRFKLQGTNPPEDNNQNANSDQSSTGNEPLILLDQPSTSGQSSIEKNPSILVVPPSTSGQSSEDPSILLVQASTSGESSASKQPSTLFEQHSTSVQCSHANQIQSSTSNISNPQHTQLQTPSSSPKLSFEAFIRRGFDQFKRNQTPTRGEPTKKRRLTARKGEILTSQAAAKRIEAVEKEKREKQIKKDERQKKKAENSLQTEATSTKKKDTNCKRFVKDSDSSSCNSYELDYAESEDEPETFSDLENDRNNENISAIEKCIDIRVELYYAIFYDISWYIGRIIEFVDEDMSKIKFLKNDLDKFIWPKSDEIQLVKNCFIFHGPLQLKGTGPFELSRSDLLKIKKKICCHQEVKTVILFFHGSTE